MRDTEVPIGGRLYRGHTRGMQRKQMQRVYHLTFSNLITYDWV